MFILRCTKPLLARVKTSYPPAGAQSFSTTALGDWYATESRFETRSIVIAVAEHSRLCVVCEPASPAELVADLQARLAVVLRDIGIPVPAINLELRRMAAVKAGPTRSRSVLGSLVSRQWYVSAWFEVAQEPFTIDEITRDLSTMQSALLKWYTPAQVADRLVWESSFPEP
ncbi:MAG: hypothetical protein IT357_05370 [Gemmatimonadaceae bacterium]|nr:hypothetical protein [Gemmatimonadaceae bacterium]